MGYSPDYMKIDPLTNSATLKITEAAVGDFQKDPLTFIEDKFDIQNFIALNQEYNFDSYDIHFKTKNGFVKARYDKEGEIISTYQRFKNLALPDDVKLEILTNYKNSQVLKNSHIVTSKNLMVDKEIFKVKIQDGTKVRTLRLHRNNQSLSLAGF